MTDFDQILKEIESRTGVPLEELKIKIDKKHDELSGLITKEGAAHLIAKELGLDLFSSASRKLEIKNIVSGMKNLNVIGRIFRVSNVIDFKKSNGSSGKVVNIFVGDLTGFVRIPLWNEQVSFVEDEKIKLGDMIQIVSGMSKENIYGDIEISLGKYGAIRPIDDSLEIPPADSLLNKFFSTDLKRTEIENLMQGNAEIKGVIVDVFKTSFLFYNCPVCGKKLKEQDGKYSCEEHKEASPSIVLSCVVDDGTGDIRAVIFRDIAERILGISSHDLSNMEREKRYELVYRKIAGKEFVFHGKVKRNKMFDTMEMIVDDFKDINPSEESKKLLDNLTAS